MKMLNEFLGQLNITAQCKKYNVSLWQCPQFLFLIMGIFVISFAIAAYIIGNRYINDPLEVALIVLIFVAFLFTIAYVIIRNFEGLTEANRIKSEFISIATHQLRSPLSNLRWTIELLMSGKIGKIEKKQTEYFWILKENINRMQELISNLLTISRIEAAKLPIKKKVFPMEKLVKDLIEEYKPFAKSSNVEISLKSQKGLSKIFSDPMQIKIVVENLLDNSIRYIKSKGKVQINLERKGNNIFFSIADNGVGIPQTDQTHIFKKFFRSGNVLRYQTQGAGLGLYISKNIVKNLKGKIGFKSKENEGSTFWFTIPINHEA